MENLRNADVRSDPCATPTLHLSEVLRHHGDSVVAYFTTLTAALHDLQRRWPADAVLSGGHTTS